MQRGPRLFFEPIGVFASPITWKDMSFILKCFVTTIAALALLAQCVAQSGRNPSRSAGVQPAKYPATRRVDVVENMHGIDVHDPYRWLEDDTADEVKGWMHEQDAFTRASIAQIGVRDDLLRRMQSLTRQDRRDVPQHTGHRSRGAFGLYH
jgi:prolyl oligopeptidase